MAIRLHKKQTIIQYRVWLTRQTLAMFRCLITTNYIQRKRNVNLWAEVFKECGSSTQCPIVNHHPTLTPSISHSHLSSSLLDQHINNSKEWSNRPTSMCSLCNWIDNELLEGRCNIMCWCFTWLQTECLKKQC